MESNERSICGDSISSGPESSEPRTRADRLDGDGCERLPSSPKDWLAVFRWSAIIPAILFYILHSKKMEESPSGDPRAISSSRRLTGTEDVARLRPEHKAVTHDFYSSVHCVGENFGNDAWKYRSCQFRNLCLDTQSKEYVLFPSQEEMDLQQLLDKRLNSFASSSSVMQDKFVSLGTLTPHWKTQHQSLRWFPRVETDRTQLDARGVYMLPSEILLVPFHSFRGTDPANVVWDDWFPIFLLMNMFGLEEKQLLVVRQVLEQPMEGTCDASADNARSCQSNFDKLRTLLGLDSSELLVASNDFPTAGSLTPYVCAQFGASGLGMVSSHVLKASGWTADDYKLTHLVGYGALMWQFRTFVAKKLFREEEAIPSEVNRNPFVVSFVSSSASSVELGPAANAIKQLFSASPVQVQVHNFDVIDVKEQASITSRSTVMVTDCHGFGFGSAVFLPRHSSLLIHCPKDATFFAAPARLQWELLNHAGYFRTIWLTEDDLNVSLPTRIKAVVSKLLETSTV